MRSYTAAHVLNPLAAPFMGLCQMKDAIKDLRKFQLDEFCPGHGILDSMAEEIPSYLPLIESTPDSFWTSVEEAKKYSEMLEEKRAKDPKKWNEKIWMPLENRRGWSTVFLRKMSDEDTEPLLGLGQSEGEEHYGECLGRTKDGGDDEQYRSTVRLLWQQLQLLGGLEV